MKPAPVTIQFIATPYILGKWLIVRVPEEESVKLSSRGQIAVTGTINGHEFETVLEPDGYWSHWMRVGADLQKTADIQSGQAINIELTATKNWPEPVIPTDFADALESASDLHDLWSVITPMARWEWVRWINATRDSTTRQRRVEVSISKMRSGKRRPCCFNLAACTDPDLSRSGRLVEPSQIATS